MKENTEKYFKLNNIQEVRDFDNSLNEYCKNNSFYKQMTPYFELEKWFNFCNNKHPEEGGRIFTSVIDIKLNFIFLDNEMTSASLSWDKLPKEQASINILTDFSSFTNSINILKDYSNYTLRYRAIWDKIMGLMILLYSPKEYSDYLKGKGSSRSRKGKFLDIMEKGSHYFTEPAKHIVEFIESFDNEFRTAEAHGTGVLRKWILQPSTLTKIKIDYPNTKLQLDYWNNLITIIYEIEQQIFPGTQDNISHK